MILKKYRIQKADGKSVIIEAENMEKAITIAKSKFGQLPNEINAEIIGDVLSKLSLFCERLSEEISNMREDRKSYEWGVLYDKLNQLSEEFTETSLEIKTLSSSMVKINKEIVDE